MRGISAVCGSEPLGPQQGVGQVKQQARGDEAGKRVIEDHGRSPLKPFAGVGVAYARREQTEPEGQHDDVQHEMLLVALLFVRNVCLFPGRRIAWINESVVRPTRVSGREVPPGA